MSTQLTQNLNDTSRVGADLTRLREAAGLKQSQVAATLGVDTSRVSRIETGQHVPDESEVGKIAQAIGRPEALEYATFAASSWSHIPKPGFWHPSRTDLHQAEKLFAKLSEFDQRQQKTDGPKAQANLHRESLMRAVEFLTDTNHSIAFVGEIGVGKSTAICGITGLLLPPDPKAAASLSKRVVLETGAGRVTLCEVHLRSEGKTSFGLLVSPQPQEEVFRCVSDFCSSIIDIFHGLNGNPTVENESRGVSEELNKAIRNMAKLARTPGKSPDGKPIRIDPAMALAKACNGNLAELTAEVLKRMRLDQRTSTEFRFEATDLVAGLRQLRDLFASVNKGLLPDVSLPRRIDLIVPIHLLGERPFNVRVIDTKGIDDTAIRPDIRAYLDDPRTVTVLCSGFRNAPDMTLRLLMENLASTGADKALSERVVLLVLARAQEVSDTQDDVGNRAETAEEGYRIKQDQVSWSLNQVSGAQELPILFLDVLNDDHHAIVEQLAHAVTRLRGLHSKRIGQVGSAIEELIQRHGEEQTRKAQEEVRNRLRIFISQHLSPVSSVHNFHDSLISAARNTNARTVWASTTRKGTWPGMEAYHLLGTGTAIDAQRRTQPLFASLDGLLENMLGDTELDPACDYLNELRRNIPTWRERFLNEATISGREIYRAELFVDEPVWSECVNYWGQKDKYGYRNRIADCLKKWCETRPNLAKATERHIQSAWRDCFLRPLALLCDAVDLLSANQEAVSDSVEEFVEASSPR
ncbi:MAG: helix-turn-helix transcriptional regulator [Chthoniobacteraceae bacterium]